ncbi:MAG: hypothetical protein IBJ11_07450 [Phycisphaerales bacterium]|nr:hypothetical protein [Phycisphaerales bacterium]
MPHRPLIAAILLGASLGALAGCNVVAGAAYLVEGPPKIERVFELQKDRTTVVFVDDVNNRIPRRSLRDLIGRAAEEEMLAQKVVAEGKMLSSVSARRAASNETSENRLSIADVGRRVGADVVVHVSMDTWALAQEGAMRPTATANVRIIDARKNERIWPAENAYRLNVEIADLQQGGTSFSASDRSAMEEKLARRFGLQIARMFYTYERPNLNARQNQN